MTEKQATTKSKISTEVKKPSAGVAVATKEKESVAKKPAITEITATARFIRVAPRKVRLVTGQLKGLTAVEALGYLQFVRKAAVQPVYKLLKSAVANAEHNFQFDRNDLFIKQFTTNDGPTLKRYRPRAHGRSAQIAKRTSHIAVILGVREGAKAKVAAAKTSKKTDEAGPTATAKKATAVKQEPAKAKEAVKVVSPETIRKEGPRTPGRGPVEKGKSQKGFLNKFFNRKTG